jgi:hypothetical protein
MADINELLIDNIKKNNINEIIQLLKNGADIDYNLGIPLYYAIMSESCVTVKLLIDMGADININHGYFLCDTCRYGYGEITLLLIKEGIIFDTKKYNPILLINLCIPNDDVDSLVALIQHDILKITSNEMLYYPRYNESMSISDACLRFKAKKILEFLINNHREIIPNKLLVKTNHIEKYNFIKMLIDKNLLDIPD